MTPGDGDKLLRLIEASWSSPDTTARILLKCSDIVRKSRKRLPVNDLYDDLEELARVRG